MKFCGSRLEAAEVDGTYCSPLKILTVESAANAVVKQVVFGDYKVETCNEQL